MRARSTCSRSRIRETALIAALREMGWGHSATHFNMTCDLRAWSSPGHGAIFGDVDGYRVRRADPGERDALRGLIEREWGVIWRDAAPRGLAHEPVSVFVAERDGEPVGFAAYEVDQCLGSFGPTGVAREHRGHGLGRATAEELPGRPAEEAPGGVPDRLGGAGPVLSPGVRRGAGPGVPEVSRTFAPADR
ncbi:MAG TPA: GNAT family N-acetyltransferase [Methylomirabilota bacterium]|nr:GNAT family N-acetyltransferase [Methylomirabilota bacterium]